MEGWLERAKGWGALAVFALATLGCSGKQSQVMNEGPGVSGVKSIGGRRVINLFGLRDAERHLIEVGTHRGQLFLLHQDAETGDFEWVDCPLETPYEYTQHPRRTHEMEIHNTAELAAELPMSQAQFQASLERGNWFKFSWAAVGSYTPGKFQLPRTNPECSRATHFVQLLTVGAVTWSEMTNTAGGAVVDAKVAKIGARGSSGEKVQDMLGNLEACFTEAESGQSGADCKIPLQVSVASLRGHHWCPEGNRACEQSTAMAPSTCLEPGPGCLPKPDAAPVAEAQIVPIYRGELTASRYMSEAIERALMLRSSGALRPYGYIRSGALLYGGIVRPGETYEARLELEAGREYALVAAGDSDAQDLDMVVTGTAEASDTAGGRDSTLKFRASSSGTATFALKAARVASKEGTFVAVVVLEKGGNTIAPETIRTSVLRAFERGGQVSTRLGATRFHDQGWSFFVLGMQKGVFRHSGVTLPVGSIYAFAVADDSAKDIDIGLVAGDEVEQIDSEPDTQPIVGVDRDRTIVGDLLIASEGEALTVVTAALLEKPGEAATVARCEQGDFSQVRVGTRLVLGRHTEQAGDDNWADGMTQYVGRVATVTERVGQDKSGCEVVRVDVDSGNYAWRLRDMRPDEGGIPTDQVLAQGRWQFSKRGDMVVVWRADKKVAAEFWDGSNGWWNWMTGGKSFTVWSAGSKDPDDGNFKVKPWQQSFTPKRAERRSFQVGNQKFELVGETLVVTMSDGGQVTFQADGAVSFRTFDGRTVKM